MTDKTDSKEREALRSIGEEQAFEAWFKVDCPVEGANAKIAAKAAWKAGRASLAANAGGEPVAPEDYVPMLDDEGRMMIGASHHYTAENIRALVAEYKALEAGAPEALERYSNSDHRTRAGVLWRVIAALADEVPFTHPSPPEGMVGGWMPIETAPEGQMVVVGWLDPEDAEHPERHDFDLLEDGCWQQWHEHAEHVEIIGGHGVSYTPPYTVWMPLPQLPTTSAGSKGE